VGIGVEPVITDHDLSFVRDMGGILDILDLESLLDYTNTEVDYQVIIVYLYGERIEKALLSQECAKLDPKYKQALAEEGFSKELEEWPEY